MKFMTMSEINLTSMQDKFDVAHTQRLPMLWSDKLMNVYRIPLEYLYYNDLNDRIATYISKYNASNSTPISDLPKEKRNDIIEEYIIDSDKDHFDKTESSIETLGQLEYWIVLSDWRVIDGNRRFTCLRNLRKKTWNQKFKYFNGIILDNVDEKEIKIIELMIQQWKDEKVDYNPIEKLVWIYRDLIKWNTITLEEYARYTWKDKGDIKKMIEKAEIMVDFLEYIWKPEKFFIAKELELDSPLTEISTLKKRIWNDPAKWAKARDTLYVLMYTNAKNDMNEDIKLTIRNFWNKILQDDKRFNDYFEKHKVISRKIRQKISDQDSNNNDDDAVRFVREEIRWDPEISEGINTLVKNSLYEAKKEEIKMLPLDKIRELCIDLNSIDKTSISKLEWDTRKEFAEQLGIMQKIIDNINKILDEND